MLGELRGRRASGWTWRPAIRPTSGAPIELEEIGGSARGPRVAEASLLRFRLGALHPRQLDAVRRARLAMIREEWTRGTVEGEPSILEATFSPVDVSWLVPIGEEAFCREKMAGLVRRANRLIADPSFAS